MGAPAQLDASGPDLRRPPRPTALPALAVVTNEAAELAVLRAAIEQTARQRPAGRALRVLEAGCGRRWPLVDLSPPIELIGIDLNPEALRIRVEQVGDLHEAIVGDLRTADFGPGAFDVVWCSYVLEHVEGADGVLDNLARWLAPGGVLVVRVPDRDSAWGFLARHAPHRTHVWFRRHITGMVNAGKPGYGPYPVVYPEVISRRGLRDWAGGAGLELVSEVGSSADLDRRGPRAALLRTGLRVVDALSRGRLAGRHNNLAFVLRRPAQEP